MAGKKMKMVTKPSVPKLGNPGVDGGDTSMLPEAGLHARHAALGAQVVKSIGAALANPSMDGGGSSLPPVGPPLPMGPLSKIGMGMTPDMGQGSIPPPNIPPPIPGAGIPPMIPPISKPLPSRKYTQKKPTAGKSSWSTKRTTAGNKISSVGGKSPAASPEQQKQIKAIIK